MTELNDSKLFIEALKNNDLTTLEKIPKSDLHNHATRGCSIKYLENKYNTKIKLKDNFFSLEDMNDWYNNNIKILFSNEIESFIERVKSAFWGAKEDNIKNLSMSFGTGNLSIFNNNWTSYIETIETLRKEIIPDCNFIPELCLVRQNLSKEKENIIKEGIDTGYFSSIDLVGDEYLGVSNFIEIFEYAKEKGLKRRVHVGEFTNSKYINEAIDLLDIDEIQHGISCIESKELMKKIKSKNVVLNLCPYSNIKLKRVESLEKFPLRELLDNNIKVTINTDDLVIFNKNNSSQFLDLYNTGKYSAEELDKIRIFGLNIR